MEKNKKIAIIGHLGAQENIMDGQTVKTRILYQELTEATDWDIQIVDTSYRSRKPLKFVLQTIKALCTIRDIIVLLSINGMRFYFPFLSFFSKVFHTRVYHDVIGGNLAHYVVQYPAFGRYLNSFQVNWVETEGMKTALNELGVTNVEVIPNFKRLSICSLDSLQTKFEPPYRFCTFSRVMKEKGIETAVEAVESINAKTGRTLCALDIYGKIDDGYTETFDELIKSATSAVQYCGIVPFDKSVETIRDYYALLFPTYWDGEGFAGTIVDAFSAGLPVIATDWNSNGEIVESGVNGILYPNKQIANLQEAINWAIQNPGIVAEMKQNCIRSAQCYQPDNYVKLIIDRIDAFR